MDDTTEPKSENVSEKPDEDSDSANDPIPFDPALVEKLLQTECKGWQKKLRLQDWNVRVHLVRLNEMPDREAIGAIFPVPERKDARMLLLSPMDAPLLAGGFMGGEELNYGLTIIHELLHLHTCMFTSNQTEAEAVAEEQAVNAISRCIFNAYAKLHKPILTPKESTVVGHYL